MNGENFPSRKPKENKPENDALAAEALLGGDTALNKIGAKLIRNPKPTVSLEAKRKFDDSMERIRKEFEKRSAIVDLIEDEMGYLRILGFYKNDVVHAVEPLALTFFAKYVNFYISHLDIVEEMKKDLVNIGIDEEKLGYVLADIIKRKK